LIPLGIVAIALKGLQVITPAWLSSDAQKQFFVAVDVRAVFNVKSAVFA